MNLLVVIVLGAVIIYQGITNYIERKDFLAKENDLLDRVMSKDYSDYATNLKLMTEEDNVNAEDVVKELLEREAQGLPVS